MAMMISLSFMPCSMMPSKTKAANHGIVSRDVEPELLVDCLRKVSEGHPWLDSRGIEGFFSRHLTLDVVVEQDTRNVHLRL